jgi:CheY-like chemotaxis protein
MRTTVLLAEDEPALLWIYRAVLEAEGYVTLAAADGAEALALAEAHSGPIGLLISDVRMPRLGGFDLATRLRRSRPGLKVLFVSGHADAAPGGEPLLAKPFRPRELAAAVSGLLGP